MTRLRAIAPPLLFAAGLIALWYVVAELRLVSPVFLPPPTRAFDEIASRFSDGTIWTPILSTLGRMTLGWLFASLAGIALGAAIGLTPLARDLLEPTLEFLRPLPASAMIPVAILFFGLSEQMSSIFGFGAVSVRLREVADILGMSRIDYLVKIAAPSAMPDILAGMRSGLAISLILAVVTEMQASLPGLGRDIFLAQRSFRSAELYAGLVMLGLIGVLINHGLQLVESRLLRWRPRRD